MPYILKLAAYVFLALMGLSAWQTYSGGWRYYFGIALFMVCVLRILMLLRQRMPDTRKGTHTLNSTSDTANDSHTPQD
jgi:cytochrome b561